MWYNSAIFEEPDAPHSIMGSANGVDWYTMQPHSEAPGFESGSVDTSQSGATFTGTSESGFGEASVIPSAPVDNPGMDTGSPLSAPSDSYSYVPDTSGFAPMPPSDSPSEVSDTALGSASGSVSLSADEPVFDAGTPISVQNSSASDVEIPFGMPITEAEAQSFYANPMSGSNDSVSHVEDTPAADFAPVPDSSYHAETPEAPAATPTSDYSSPVSQSDAAFTPAESTPNTDTASFFTDSEVFSDFSAAYNQALFKNFMPGYEQPITSVDDSGRSDGHFEVRHADGSGTMFFDSTRYSEPRGDFQTLEDSRGGKWYAVSGQPAVERRPVYENGKPVYDGENVKTISVETVRYRNLPAKRSSPAPRRQRDSRTPKKKT